jgi:hypothetical protein
MSLAEELLADLEEGDDDGGDESLESAYNNNGESSNKVDHDDPMAGGIVSMDVDENPALKGNQ